MPRNPLEMMFGLGYSGGPNAFEQPAPANVASVPPTSLPQQQGPADPLGGLNAAGAGQGNLIQGIGQALSGARLVCHPDMGCYWSYQDPGQQVDTSQQDFQNQLRLLQEARSARGEARSTARHGLQQQKTLLEIQRLKEKPAPKAVFDPEAAEADWEP